MFRVFVTHFQGNNLLEINTTEKIQKKQIVTRISHGKKQWKQQAIGTLVVRI